ncbi:hypothetical protein ACGFMM_12475 [Streptomyces sp. NPDC048604]|uniref:hypothetical protein n=1 Tax=Streptomyces sp. NPDC048604 TaxID=3365578 RepID=UPI0037156D27
MRNTTRRRAVAALAAGAALGAVLAMPGAAHAANADSVCNRGEFCAYSGTGLTGSVRLDRVGDWSGSVSGVRSLVNKGNPQTGADHIRYSGWVNYGSYYRQVTGCLHYDDPNASGWTPGSWVTFPATTGLTSAKWGGECSSGEPTMKLGRPIYA